MALCTAARISPCLKAPIRVTCSRPQSLLFIVAHFRAGHATDLKYEMFVAAVYCRVKSIQFRSPEQYIGQYAE